MTAKSATFIALAGFLALLGIQFYGMHSTRAGVDARIAQLQGQIQSTHDAEAAQISNLATDLDVVRDRVGVTAQDIQIARKSADAIKQEQTKAANSLRNEIAEHSKAVAALREESGAQIEEVKQSTSTQIGAATGEVRAQVQAVNGEVDTVKSDLSATKTDLAASRREIGDVRDSLGRQIAHNSDEVAVLKRRGERDYFEFDLRKSSTLQRVAGIQLQLTKADVKAQKYDVNVLVDDAKLAKKGQLINEPVQLLVGRDRVRYEVVVNSVEKDHVRGYVSAPKDSLLSAEGPAAR